MSIFTDIFRSSRNARAGRSRDAAVAIVLTFGLAGGSLGMSSTPAQAQGLLESLFGRSQAPAHQQRGYHDPRRGGQVHHGRNPYYPPGYRDDGFNPYASADYERRRAAAQRAQQEERRRAAQRAAERERQRAAAEPTPPEPYTPPKVGAGPLGPFLYDTSLRRGDVVVTGQGLMVFAGRDGARQHSERDFRPLAQASRLTGPLAEQLRAIETSNSIARSAAVRVEPAPVARSGDGDRQVAEATARQ